MNGHTFKWDIAESGPLKEVREGSTSILIREKMHGRLGGSCIPARIPPSSVCRLGRRKNSPCPTQLFFGDPRMVYFRIPGMTLKSEEVL